MDSVTAAEWLQCLTSKLRYFFRKYLNQKLDFIQNVREEKEKKVHDMETLPLKSTISFE